MYEITETIKRGKVNPLPQPHCPPPKKVWTNNLNKDAKAFLQSYKYEGTLQV